MVDRDQDMDSTDIGLSTDVGEEPQIGTRIGAVPGHGTGVDISGYPGGGTGAGAWPDDMGTDTATEADASTRESNGGRAGRAVVDSAGPGSQ